MAMKRVDPKQQFSKWLARYGAWFWGLYMLVIAVLIYLRPEASMPCFYLALVVTANKALDTISYTDNSKTEKILLTGLERSKIELDLKGVGQSISGGQKEDDGDEKGDVSDDDGKGGNG